MKTILKSCQEIATLKNMAVMGFLSLVLFLDITNSLAICFGITLGILVNRMTGNVRENSAGMIDMSETD